MENLNVWKIYGYFKDEKRDLSFIFFKIFLVKIV